MKNQRHEPKKIDIRKHPINIINKKNNVEVKTKMAQSFNISTEKLDEFVSNYLK